MTTNIDELREILFDFIGATDNALILPDHEKELAKAEQDILQHYIPKAKVLEAVGKDEPYTVGTDKFKTGLEIRNKGRNQLRAEIKKRLGVDNG